MTAAPDSRSSSPGIQGWLRGIGLGALCGAIVLGAGGRLAMRGVAVVQEWNLSFSIAGSTTVVMMGVLAGVAGAVIALTRWSIPRLPAALKPPLFWLAAVLITYRVLQPIDRDRVMMFAPVVLVYGLAQVRLVRQASRRRPRPLPPVRPDLSEPPLEDRMPTPRPTAGNL